ncbi:aminoglycoside phosphotransferase family protein [Photobacterium sp. OFAV2-7]|uniref:aminoglycoside phosphotransferase family protein n=1 Tax=Photobacterium sp. OFAV2-7 TaxID=2917748 RepID=UPI001EF40FBB|nr:aminoglycoside phosphotransferase family protein [Photobacterium sp. OFAV2-7]MCG7587661.1 aminoglycoside phosphotransferase family protein [Photobacterium sp. OFAV2-7]
MEKILTASSILIKIGSSFTRETQGLTKEEGCRHFFIIPGNNGPRWLLPDNSNLACCVLKDWQPYSLLSLLKWILIQKLYSLNLISMVPSIGVVNAPFNNCKVPGNDDELIPVIYVGTPGYQQKAVATLINTTSGEAVSVMKTALSEGGASSVLKEARMLDYLSHTGVKNIPRLLAIDEHKQQSWQSVVSGKPSSKKFSQLHINWLLQLPHNGEHITLDQQNTQLAERLESNRDKFTRSQQDRLEQGISYIKGNSLIPLLLVHGDFAPWNIKVQSNLDKQEIAVIDWEDARIDGLPLWDISHFYLIQAHLFNTPELITDLLSNSLTHSYMEKCGITDVDVKSLVLLYILFSSLNNSKNTDEHYKNYLIQTISRIIKQ